ncbi:MAG: ATP-binding protein, partial [Bacteroidota bacterium]
SMRFSLYGAVIYCCLLSSVLTAQREIAYWDSLYHDVRVQADRTAQQKMASQITAWAATQEDTVAQCLANYVLADQFLQLNRLGQARSHWELAAAYPDRFAVTQPLAVRIQLIGGRLAQAEGKVNSAIFNYEQAQELAGSRLPELWLQACGQLTEVYLQSGNYRAAYDELEEASRLIQRAKSPISNRLEVYVERLRGDLFAEVGLDTLAVQTLEGARLRAATLRDTAQNIKAILALGRFWRARADTASSRNAYQLAYEQAEAFDNLQLLTKSLLGLGELSHAQQDTTAASTYFEQAWELMQLMELPDISAEVAARLGVAALDQEQLDTAYILCSQAYETANTQRLRRVQLDACQCLQDISERKGDWQSALLLLKEYQRLEQAASEEQVLRTINAQNFQDQLRELSDQRIAERKQMQSVQQQTQADLEAQRQRNRRLAISLVGVLVLAGLIFWFLRKNRQKNRELNRLNHELHRANQQLEVANEALAENNEALNRFAAVAAHDLKGPLRSIQSFSQLLRRKLGDRVQINEQEYFDFIIESTTRLATLIDDLLNFSRLDKGAVAPQPVDLQQTLDVVTANLHQDISEKQANITYQDLPKVAAQGSLMTQLFQNLLSNSLKFIHSDVPPVITLSSRPIGKSRVRIEVQDNGIGIAKQHQEQVFELFSRLHTSDAYEGSGVGLATCRKIVQSYSGKMGIASEEGRGTTVWIELPLAR